MPNLNEICQNEILVPKPVATFSNTYIRWDFFLRDLPLKPMGIIIKSVSRNFEIHGDILSMPFVSRGLNVKSCGTRPDEGELQVGRVIIGSSMGNLPALGHE